MAALGAALVLAGCGGEGGSGKYKSAADLKKEQKDKPKKVEAHDHDHEHSHTAPHGGQLKMLGDHAAQLEFLHDPASGKLSFYVLDGEAENPFAVDATEIKATIKLSGREEPLEATFQRTDSGGDVLFTFTSDELKNQTKFEINVAEFQAGSQSFKEIDIDFDPSKPPEKHTDHDHDHDHDHDEKKASDADKGKSGTPQ